MVATSNKELIYKETASRRRLGNGMLRRRLIVWPAAIVFGMLAGSFLISSPSAAADGINPTGYTPPGSNGYNCGVANNVNGGPGDNQQAAGLVVNVQYRTWNGSSYDDPKDDTTGHSLVQVSTYHTTPAFPNGGIARLSANDNNEDSLNSTVTFRQVQAACVGNPGGYEAVLGYGVTSPNVGDGWNHWALDCQERARWAGGNTDDTTYYSGSPGAWSPNPDSAHYQPYVITGAGTGAADIPANAKPGGSWATQLVSPHNGRTAYITLVYFEPKTAPGSSTGGGQCTITDASNTSTFYSYNKRTEVRITGVNNASMQYTDGGGHTTYYANDPAYDSANHVIDEFVPGPGGENTDGNTTAKKWGYFPNQNTIHVTITTEVYNYPGHSGWWAPTSQPDGTAINPVIQDSDVSCFAANCNNPLTIDGDGPQNIVLASGAIHVSGTYANTGPLDLYNPALIGSDGGTYGIGVYDLAPNTTVPFSFDMPAPGYNASSAYGFTLTPEYIGSGAIGTACSATVPIYQQFEIDPSTKISDGTNPENPYETDGVTHGISYTVGGSLKFGPTISATTNGSLTKNSPTNTVDGVHSTTDSYGVNISHQYDHADSGFQAGDQYCPHVTVSPATGYHGPAGYADVNDLDGTVDGACITITNEPYFKAFSSSISARNGITPSTTAVCAANTNNSGLLAGWNDNQDFGTDRGAGSGLSNIALIRITGVASAQTDITRSPADLTFANNNTGDITSNIDSPNLGGNFGGSPTCINPPVITPTATLGGTAGVPAAAGDYQTAGDLTLTGGTPSSTGTTSIHVNGDVYITNDISYGSNPSWSVDAHGNYSGPLFKLVATGNIYIDPGVTQLDGIYVSQPKDSSNGGTIYTCATGLSAPPANYDFYNNCNKQLVVTGAFMAGNVKLLRTFGSLRNEEPQPGPPPGQQIGLAWYRAGPPSGPLPANMNCTQISEPKDPNTWNDNYLCFPNTNTTLKLAWTNQGDTKNPGSHKCNSNQVSTGKASVNCLIANGYSYCTPWNPVGVDSKHGWSDDYLCMNQKVPGSTKTPLIQFSNTNQSISDPTQYCTNIQENGPDGNWATTGYWLCEPKAAAGGGVTPTGPPFTGCSNAIVQINTNTCAGEVFQFSPEMYLASPPPPADQPNNGAIQYDAITSLPPVL